MRRDTNALRSALAALDPSGEAAEKSPVASPTLAKAQPAETGATDSAADVVEQADKEASETVADAPAVEGTEGAADN